MKVLLIYPPTSESESPVNNTVALDAAQARGFAEEIGSRLGLEVIVVDGPQHAVSGCDMVVTAGPILKTPHGTIQPGWMDEGTFASLIDFDSYWHPDAMHEATKFCTDDVPQLNHYQGAGYFQEIPPVYAGLEELGDSLYQTMISKIGAKDLNKLPKAARTYIQTIESMLDVKVQIISTGQRRDELIVLKEQFE